MLTVLWASHSQNITKYKWKKKEKKNYLRAGGEQFDNTNFVDFENVS